MTGSAAVALVSAGGALNGTGAAAGGVWARATDANSRERASDPGVRGSFIRGRES
jgi:hypothetical protein